MARLVFLVAALCFASAVHGAGELPSWNDGTARQGIVAFVQAVSDPNGKDFVPATERIAVFDNDGTLWSEQPIYFQFVSVLDQVKAAAPGHPE